MAFDIATATFVLEFAARSGKVLMSKCAVCGLEYGLTHACTGIPPMTSPDETGPPPPLRFAPAYYFGEAFKILLWDDAAVRRAARDNNSLVYGSLIVAIGSTLPFGLLALRSLQMGYPIPWNLMGSRYLWLLFYSLAWIAGQIGLAHGLAKILFDAKGTYLGVLRAYMLGQTFRWLIVFPLIGGLLVGVGGVAVLMMAFEEVDDIERMKAFGLSATIGVVFWIASIWVATSGPRPLH